VHKEINRGGSGAFVDEAMDVRYVYWLPGVGECDQPLQVGGAVWRLVVPSVRGWRRRARRRRDQFGGHPSGGPSPGGPGDCRR